MLDRLGRRHLATVIALLISLSTQAEIASPGSTKPQNGSQRVTASAASSIPLGSSAAGNTSSTSLTEKIRVPGTNRWGAMLINWSTFKAVDTQDQTGSGHADNFMGLTYTFSKKVQAQVRQPFGINYPTTGSALSHVERQDLQLWLTNSDMGQLPGGIKMSGAIRYWAPTGENVQSDMGHLGTPNLLFTMTKPWTPKFSTSWNIIPHYWINRRDATIKYTEAAGYEVKGNPDFRLMNWLSADYAANSRWTFTEYAIYDQKWNRAVKPFVLNGQDMAEVRGARVQVLDVGTAVTYTHNKYLSITAGVENEHNMDQVYQDQDRFELYRQTKNTYFLISSVTY